MSEQNSPMICIEIKKGKKVYSVHGLRSVSVDYNGTVWIYLHASQRHTGKHDSVYFAYGAKIIEVRFSQIPFDEQCEAMKILN